MKSIVPMLWVLIALTPAALAEPYWIAWEGDDFPENQGWKRNYGNWDGQWQGQANRTLEDGILTIDSLHDTGVFDFVYMERPGQIDPEAGEMFVAEWRLLTEAVVGDFPYDLSVSFASDDAYRAGFQFNQTTLMDTYGLGLSASFDAGRFHEFRFESPDMRSFDLYIDGNLALSGPMIQLATQSYAGWGDGIQGAASLSAWDYFRFGVLPEPSAGIAGFFAALVAGRTR